jgi:hypothetical protein
VKLPRLAQKLYTSDVVAAHEHLLVIIQSEIIHRVDLEVPSLELAALHTATYGGLETLTEHETNTLRGVRYGCSAASWCATLAPEPK